jgi:poly(3-hydroxybutyrate) depolymerase
MKLKITLISLFVALTSTLFAITGTTTITSNGIPRTYIYYAPGASVNVNLPVMIVMHGDGGSATSIRSYSGFDAVADAQNFLVIYPNAVGGNWNRSADNVAGDACTGSANTSNDVLFISDLIDHLCATYQINKNKVYASGHSAGGFMAYNLAIQLTNKIAAFAPVAGLLCGDNNFLSAALAANSPVPVYHIHGDADNTVSYPDGDNTPTSYGEWPLAAFSVDACGSDTYTSTVTLMPSVKKHVFCAGPKEVSLIQIVGGGHNWPSVAGFNAAAAIYTFCSAYSLNLLPSCVVADVTAPLLSSTSPVDNASGIALNPTITATFNENIALGAGSISLVRTVSNTIIQTFGLANMSISGGTLTLTLSSNLTNLTDYHLVFANNAITDIAGNNFAGISNASTWNFTTLALVDNSPPLLASPFFSPVDNSVDLPINSQFTMIFNENIIYMGGAISIINTTTSGVHETFDAGSINVFGSSLTLTLTTALQNATAYHVVAANNAIADLSGNSFAGFANTSTYNFTTVAGADVTAPALVSPFSPADNAINVSLNTSLVVNFNENIFLLGGLISIVNSATSAVVQTFDPISMTIIGGTLNLNLSTALLNNTTYHITIANTAIADAAGNYFAGFTDATTWNFTTVAANDITAPVLIALPFVPADNEMNVAVNAPINAVFNENIVLGSGAISLVNTTTGAIVQTFAPGYVNIVGTTLNLNIIANLSNNTAYHITIANSALTDVAGNYFAGFTDAATWNFTTVVANDINAPVLISLPFTPADNAMNVAINTPITVTFNEDIMLGGGIISLINTNSNVVVQSFNPGATAVNGEVLTLILSANLQNNTNYHINITTNAVRDLAGNYFAGIVDVSTWNFTTVPAGDITPPVLAVLPFTPADNETNVVANPVIRALFNENISVQLGAITLYNTTTAAIVQTFNGATATANGNILNLTLLNPLTSNTAYHITIDNDAISDLSGNNFAGFTDATTWNFSTSGFTALEEVQNPVLYTIENQQLIVAAADKLNKVQVMNLAGQIIFESATAENSTIAIDTRFFANQMLIVMVETAGKVWTKKFVF